MSSEIAKQQIQAVQQQMQTPTVLGNVRISRTTQRKLQAEMEKRAVLIAEVQTAHIVGRYSLVEEYTDKLLVDALYGDDPAAQLSAADYQKALHAIGVNAVFRAAE